MWKLVNGRLIHTTDDSRVIFRTSVSQEILEHLKTVAKEQKTHVNYLLEIGMKKVLEDDFISFDKKNRPKDRIHYKSTYDKELLREVREFAAKHKLFANDVMEYGVGLIGERTNKNVNYRYRIEK